MSKYKWQSKDLEKKYELGKAFWIVSFLLFGFLLFISSAIFGTAGTIEDIRLAEKIRTVASFAAILSITFLLISLFNKLRDEHLGLADMIRKRDGLYKRGRR